MKSLAILICLTLFAFTTNDSDVDVVTLGDNYKVTSTKSTSTGKTYKIKCTDCGKYITVYYKAKSKKYAQGDSPWYTQYRSLDDAAEKGCKSRCD